MLPHFRCRSCQISSLTLAYFSNIPHSWPKTPNLQQSQQNRKTDTNDFGNHSLHKYITCIYLNKYFTATESAFLRPSTSSAVWREKQSRLKLCKTYSDSGYLICYSQSCFVCVLSMSVLPGTRWQIRRLLIVETYKHLY